MICAPIPYICILSLRYAGADSACPNMLMEGSGGAGEPIHLPIVV